MTLGAEECKADAKKVSLIHVSRIFLTVLLIPNLLLLFFQALMSGSQLGLI